jgi:predicted dehydrogenase
MRAIRLAVIGCGIAARDLHWPALKQLKNRFEIVVVCNRSEQKARDFAALTGCPDYALDYREVFARKDVEAVDLVLPIPLNLEVTRAALAAGKHVLVEKPVAANRREALAMVRLEKKHRQVTMVAENFRYRKTLRRLKQLLDAGTIGRVYTAQYNVFLQVTPENNKYARTNWRIKHEYPGGFPVDGGVHNVHAIRYLLGEFTSVRASAQQINPAIGDVDTLSIAFETTSGATGTLNFCYSAPGLRELRLILFGTKGSVVLTGNRIEICRAGRDPKVEEIADDGGYVGEFEEFFRAIRGKNDPETSFADGWQDLRAMLAALDSAETGKTIRLRH